jgi:hypothetical protein
VMDASPWCPCRKAKRGLYVVRLDEGEAFKVREFIWEVKND